MVPIFLNKLKYVYSNVNIQFAFDICCDSDCELTERYFAVLNLSTDFHKYISCYLLEPVVSAVMQTGHNYITLRESEIVLIS